MNSIILRNLVFCMVIGVGIGQQSYFDMADEELEMNKQTIRKSLSQTASLSCPSPTVIFVESVVDNRGATPLTCTPPHLKTYVAEMCDNQGSCDVTVSILSPNILVPCARINESQNYMWEMVYFCVSTVTFTRVWPAQNIGAGATGEVNIYNNTRNKVCMVKFAKSPTYFFGEDFDALRRKNSTTFIIGTDQPWQRQNVSNFEVSWARDISASTGPSNWFYCVNTNLTTFLRMFPDDETDDTVATKIITDDLSTSDVVTITFPSAVSSLTVESPLTVLASAGDTVFNIGGFYDGQRELTFRFDFILKFTVWETEFFVN